jgi:hypothetical protein
LRIRRFGLNDLLLVIGLAADDARRGPLGATTILCENWAPLSSHSSHSRHAAPQVGSTPEPQIK